MDDLISRAAAIELIKNRQRELCPVGMFGRNAVYGTDREKFDNWQEIIDEIKCLPIMDATPHGWWTHYNCAGKDIYQCSKCLHLVGAKIDKSYCPQCGAKMDWGGIAVRLMTFPLSVTFPMLDGETREQAENRMIERIDPDGNSTISWCEADVMVEEEDDD